MRREIEILSQVQSRRVDRKQAAIQNLKTYAVEAEEQFKNALQHHLINIDTLIGLQTSRLDSLKNQFQAELSSLENEFNTER